MKTIKINNNTPIPFRDHYGSTTLQTILERTEQVLREEDVTFCGNIPDDAVYHNGYLEYLSKAWENHYSVVMRPDDVWYMILNELASVIAKAPKTYANLFTTTPDEKQMVVVLTENVETIDPEAVVNVLRNRVPSDVDTFLPKFSTSTEMCRLAMNVSFCDAVSPYYSYGTLLCGIPNIRIEGNDDDWNLVKTNLEKISKMFSMTKKVETYLRRCATEVGNIIAAIKADDKNYFDKMVTLYRCGSGHQFEMSGWILSFLYNTKQRTQLEELPPHFAHMDYTNLDTDRKFSLYCGLFYSKIQDEFLVPEYDAFRFEITGDLPEQRKRRHEEESRRPLRIISSPVASGKTNQTGANSIQKGAVYAPYILKLVVPKVINPDFYAKVIVKG